MNSNHRDTENTELLFRHRERSEAIQSLDCVVAALLAMTSSGSVLSVSLW